MNAFIAEPNREDNQHDPGNGIGTFGADNVTNCRIRFGC